MRNLLVIGGSLLFAATLAALSPIEGFAQAPAEPDPLAELAALGSAMAETEVEGGGSIRAKKDADTTRMQRQGAPENIEARVESVNAGHFPAVALKLKVTKPAKSGAGAGVAKDVAIVVVPKLKVNGKLVELADADTAINAGSYYLRKGDKVVVRLGPQNNKVWQADYIERK